MKKKLAILPLLFLLSGALRLPVTVADNSAAAQNVGEPLYIKIEKAITSKFREQAESGALYYIPLHVLRSGPQASVYYFQKKKINLIQTVIINDFFLKGCLFSILWLSLSGALVYYMATPKLKMSSTTVSLLVPLLMGNLIALLIRNVKETYEAGSIAMRPEKMLGKTWETERRWIALKGFMNKEYIQAGETLLYYTLIDTDRSAHKRVIQLMDTVNVPRKQKTLIYDPRKAEQKLKGFKPEIIQKLKEVIFEITFNANLNNLTRGAAPRKTYVLLGPPGTGKTFASIVIPNVINVPYVLEKLEGPLHDLIGLENVKSSILSQARAKALTQPNGQNFICILDDADRDMNKQTIARSSHLALFDESLPAYNDNYLKVSVPYPKFIILTSNYTLKDSALSNRVQTTIDFEDPFTEEGKVNIYIEYLHELINKYKGLPYAPMSEDFTKEDIQNMLSLIKEAEIKADDKGIRTGKHCVMEFFNRKAQEKYLDAMKQQRRQ